MGEKHPEQEAEQRYIDAAYRRLDETREKAKQRAAQHARESTTMPGQQYDRDVSVRVALLRAQSLDIGDESIIFGRTDATSDERYYIGRRNVFGEQHEAMVIDWRVPAAEPFYRATGAEPLGLAMRRHFLCEGRRLLGIEDEHFGADTELGLTGTGALLAALERPRTGTMRDIAATIRSEQDRIIRAPLEGVLAVQGGPGTGKTAVGLHRAAYLLFTHRRKLGRQGILVVGPNRLFLRYIERVLPALGESGAALVMLEDLVEGVRNARHEGLDAARVKGDARMTQFLSRAVRDRQGRGNREATFEFEGYDLTIGAREVMRAVSKIRNRRGTHNARHAMLRRTLASAIYDEYVRTVVAKLGSKFALVPRRTGERIIRAEPALNPIADAIWPLLTPKKLLAELLSSRERLRSAARGSLSDAEADPLYRDNGTAWTAADIPLLDEAFTLLGAPQRDRRPADEGEQDDIETFGHVVADEVQDLTPMALRMLGRRARSGSMTIVGDLAQSIGAVPPTTWDDILAHLPAGRGARTEELTINYRTPGAIMDVASAILAAAAPELIPPESVRAGGEPVSYVEGPLRDIVAIMTGEHRASGRGTMAIVVPPSLLVPMSDAAAATEDIGEAVSVLPVEDAKGLEFDEVVVVEPALIVDESPQGLRALYVALSRATHRVRVAYEKPLPPPLPL
ncbi:MAG: ATP-binding domain-containing protein [Actinomycetota bacterium]|nr:AAA family ATPase [Actinomycetota bacterium]